MKTARLFRYIVSEVTLQSGIALSVLLLIFMSGQILTYMELIIRKGFPFIKLFQLLALTIPALLAFTLPIAFLFGTMVAMGRFSADGEIVAMRALGLSLKQISIPVWITASATTLLTLLVTVYLMPYSNRKLRVTLEEMALHRAFTRITPHTFIQDFPGILLYISDMTPDQQTWVKPLMIDRTLHDKRLVLMADRAAVSQSEGTPSVLHIEFLNGELYEFPYLEPERYRRASFEKFVKNIRLGSDLNLSNVPKTDREMTLPELREMIRKRRRLGPTAVAGYRVEYQKRWSFPMAALVFALIGYPFAVRPIRGGKFYGSAVSILIMVTAYIGVLVGERLGDQARIPPWLAAWNPHILLGLAGAVLFFLLDRPVHRRRRWRLRLPGSVFRWPWDMGLPRRPGLFRIGYILDRYILGTAFRLFALASLALLPIFLIIEAFHLLDDLVLTHTPFSVLLKYLLVAAPGIYHQILPMIAMMTLMTAVAGLEKFREVMAMLTHGISYYRILLPLLAGTVILVGADYVLQERILPTTSTRADAYKRIIKGYPAATPVATQWAFGATGYLYHFDAFDLQRATMYGFDVYAVDPKLWRVREHCYAHEARFIEPGDWRVVRSWCRRFRPDENLRTYYMARLRLPETPDYFESTRRTADEMSARQLHAYIRDLRRKGFRTRSWEVAYVFKWVLPLGSLILFPLAASLALHGARLGLAYGIVIALLLGFGHWLLTQLGQTLGMVEALPPMQAAVIPFLATLFLGLFLFSRVHT